MSNRPCAHSHWYPTEVTRGSRSCCNIVDCFGSMQGTDDDVVHLTHGKMLHSIAKNPATPLWAEGCDHQNVELSPEYLSRLKEFMQEVFGRKYWKRYQ